MFMTGKEGKLLKIWIVNVNITKKRSEFMLPGYKIIETKETKHRGL